MMKVTAKFDSSHSDVTLLNSGMVAKSTTGTKSHAIVNQGFTSGKAWWSFKLKVDKTGDARICLGACIKPVTNSAYDTSPELWMLRPYSGACYAAGKYNDKKIEPKPVEGDVVRFDLDHAAGTLAIKVNGKDHGVCISGLPKQAIYPGTRTLIVPSLITTASLLLLQPFLFSYTPHH